MKSKIISLSAISAGFIAIALIIGAYIEITDLFMVVVASVFVLLPLYLKSYKGSFLAFLAGGIIALLCSGFNLALIFPAYFTFFGIYPIVKHKLIEKNVKNSIGLIIGLIWFIAVAYACYFYYTIVLNGVFEGLPSWIEKYIVYAIGVIAIIFFFIYDRFLFVVKFVVDKYLRKIIK